MVYDELDYHFLSWIIRRKWITGWITGSITSVKNCEKNGNPTQNMSWNGMVIQLLFQLGFAAVYNNTAFSVFVVTFN